MIQRIKTALLGDEPRTDGGVEVRHRSGMDGVVAGERPDVTEVDPFRPATRLPGEEAGDRVEMDEIFGVLGNQRRRYALTYLNMTEGTLTVGELAERIAAWECEKEIAQLNSQERKRVYVSLYQCHLPKMAENSAISYDRDRGTVEPGERFDSFTHYLRYEE